jgi:hypothetical protein
MNTRKYARLLLALTIGFLAAGIAALLLAMLWPGRSLVLLGLALIALGFVTFGRGAIVIRRRLEPDRDKERRRGAAAPSLNRPDRGIASKCVRCQGKLVELPAHMWVFTIPKEWGRMCSTCSSCFVLADTKMPPYWLYAVPPGRLFEARTPPVNQNKQRLRLMGVALIAVLSLAWLGTIVSDPAAGAGILLTVIFLTWALLPGKPRQTLVALENDGRRRALVVEDTNAQPVAVDSAGIRELRVRAEPGAEDIYSVAVVAERRNGSEAQVIVGRMGLEGAVDLAEHLAACINVPANTRLPQKS